METRGEPFPEITLAPGEGVGEVREETEASTRGYDVSMVDVLRQTLTPLQKRIHWARIYGSVARAEELATSDVDLIISGKVGCAALAPALRRAAKRLSRAVNPTLYIREEFGTRLHARDYFLTSVLDGATRCIRGESPALAAAPAQAPAPGTHRKPQST